MRRRHASGKSRQATIAQPATSFTVYIEDNFRAFMDDEPDVLGTYPTYADAATAAARCVDDSLRDLAKPGMTARQLLDAYKTFGDALVIRPPSPTGKSFSAAAHAYDAVDAIIAALPTEGAGS